MVRRDQKVDIRNVLLVFLKDVVPGRIMGIATEHDPAPARSVEQDI